MPAAGDRTLTSSGHIYGDTFMVLVNWTADSGDGSFAAMVIPWRIDGYIQKITTAPGGTAPTASYDPVLKDADGVDVTGNVLANRSATAAETVRPNFDSVKTPIYVDGCLSLTITGNSVNSATGTIKVFFNRKP